MLKKTIAQVGPFPAKAGPTKASHPPCEPGGDTCGTGFSREAFDLL
jgi:hypothetical protein